jgi:hypothetical protein
MPARPAVHPAQARRILWWSLVLLILGGFAGATWDRVWHATVPFDGFWSPPHLVVYVSVFLVSLLIMALVFHDGLRRAFGPGFNVLILPFPVPGSLVILGAGFVLLGVAGAVFDNLWHSSFGLNETAWSFPHAMIGWSLLVIACGYLAARLALNPHKTMPAFSKWLLGTLIAMLSLGVVTGALGSNRTPESTRFFFEQIPALASQADTQHLFRIYDTWNLNRTHPSLLILMPLWFGATLGFLRKLDGRWWLTLAVMVAVWATDSGNRDFGDVIAQVLPEFGREANWRAFPIVLPTLLFLLPGKWPGERARYGLAGALLALLIFDIWGGETAAWLLALVAIPVTIWARGLGERLYTLLEQPQSFRAILPLLLACVLVPLATGVLDLVLRAMTP